MAEDLRVIRDRTVELERLLEQKGAEGKGLLEKARSLPLPEATMKSLGTVAYLRNRVMHEHVDLTPEEMSRFLAAASTSKADLLSTGGASAGTTAPQASGRVGCLGTLATSGVVLVVMWILMSLFKNPLLDTLVLVLGVLMLAGAVMNAFSRK
jgi:hypothetical protein